MTKIVKVLDKGGKDHKHNRDGEVMGTVDAPSKVLERHAVDAAEIVASDPERFEIVDDETPHHEDVLGNAVRHRRGKSAEASADAGKKVAARPRKPAKKAAKKVTAAAE